MSRLKKEFEQSSVENCSDFISQFQKIMGIVDLAKTKEELSKIIQLQN
jgi:heptaprenyl diphosphate synthase